MSEPNASHFEGNVSAICGLIRNLKKTRHCEQIIQTAMTHRDKLDARADRKREQLTASAVRREKKCAARDYWRKYSRTVDGVGRLCIVCDQRVQLKQYVKYLDRDLAVLALHNGQEVVVRACSPQCQASAWERFEKEKQWLQQQQRDLKAMRRMVAIMSQEVSKLPKRELQLAESSPAS